MTVRELIEALRAVDPDLLVVLQEDAEGNGYSPLSGAEPAAEPSGPVSMQQGASGAQPMSHGGPR